ncbi:MAG: amidohydrolase family protein [Verrucomicrobia bacterium]|nr:amidohydrolase family protein [Verrucomicrobiota bacterium]
MSATKTTSACLAVLSALLTSVPAQIGKAPVAVTGKDLLAPWSLDETVLYSGATVHTVSGEVLSPGFLLAKGAKILSVSKSAPAAKADRTVDLKGLHLLPGIILPTSSLGLTEISAVRATQDTTETGAFTPDVRAWLSVNPDSELIPVTRANGITHALVLPLGGTVSGQSGVISLAGWTTEEMTVKAPVALHVFWPAMNLNVTPKELARSTKAKSPDDQSKERSRRIKELDDFFAEAHAYASARGVTPRDAKPATKVPAWEAMLPFVRDGLPLIVHADDVRQIKAALAWAGQRKYKIAIAGGRDAWRVADELAAKMVAVIFESTFDQPARDTDAYDAHFKGAATLHKAGVKVLFSEGPGASNATFARNTPYSAAQAVAFGLPGAEALKGLTLYPAQVLGLDGRLGSLEAGKEATFFASDGNILDLRSNVRRMWIAGREVPLDSRHTRLHEKYKNRPAPAAK